RDITVTETFHLQTEDKLSDKELKQIEADDQAIQTILLGLPEDIYAAVDSCETAKEIWLRVHQMMKGSDIRIQEKKAKLFNEWERFTSNEEESIESYYHHFLKLMNDLKRNIHFPEKIASNLKFLNNLQPEWSRHVTIVHQTKDLHTADYTQLYDFLKQIAQSGMNMGQDREIQIVGGNGGNRFRQYAGQNAGNPDGYNDVIGNQVIQNAIQNLRVQNGGNQNGLIGVQGNRNQNQIRNDKLLDKQIQLEKRIKELNNIVLKTGQSIQTIHMLSPKPNSFYHTEQKMALGYQNPFYLKQAQKKQQILYDGKVLLEKHDPPVVHDSEETLQLAQESRDKMKQMNKEIKPANYTKINHLSGVFVPQKALSREELYFSSNSKTANVLKSFLIPNEDLSDDTTPSVARKFLNEVKSTILTLQRVVKQRMTIKTHNWASSAHQELYKIVREEIFPIVNQVDARLQNFEIQFLKEAAKFVGDLKSLANEADASLAKHKALELEIERLLKAVVRRKEKVEV
nr:hypothetical protein [Tanacetum cinerariifolium]